ncbi:hypothetical protein BDF14DRAFT_1926966, partial [Spinellus fusiger]
ELLIRFGTGYHSKTNSVWAFPTTGKPHTLTGKGYYVRLLKDSLELFQEKEYNAAFRGAVVYRSDMVQQIEKAVYQHALDLLSTASLGVPLEQKTHGQWVVPKYVEHGFQCILVLNHTGQSGKHQAVHSCNNPPNRRVFLSVPCYYAQQIWTEQDISRIFKGILGEKTTAVGIVKDKCTVDLAVALWRVHLLTK